MKGISSIAIAALLMTAHAFGAGKTTVGVSLSPTKVALGKTSTITWNAQNATSCAASDAWSGPLYINGQQKVPTPAAAGVYTYTITCNGVSNGAKLTVTDASGGSSSSSSGGGSTSSSSGSSSSSSSSSSGSSSGGSSGAGSSSSGSSSSGSSGGTSSSSSSGGSSGGSGGSGAPGLAHVVQTASTVSAGQPGEPQGLSLTVTLPAPVQAGSAILVYATESNGGKAGLAITASDSQGNPYTKLDQVDDTSNAAWMTTMSFAAFNVPAGTLSVTVRWKELEWQGVLVAEVAGVNSLPQLVHAKNLQRNGSKAADAITTGLLTVQGPGLLLGLAAPSLDTRGAPNPGTGFQKEVTTWNWRGDEGTARVDSTLLESLRVVGPGDVAATFTALAAGDNWLTLGVFVPDFVQDGPPPAAP